MQAACILATRHARSSPRIYCTIGNRVCEATGSSREWVIQFSEQLWLTSPAKRIASNVNNCIHPHKQSKDSRRTGTRHCGENKRQEAVTKRGCSLNFSIREIAQQISTSIFLTSILSFLILLSLECSDSLK